MNASLPIKFSFVASVVATFGIVLAVRLIGAPRTRLASRVAAITAATVRTVTVERIVGDRMVTNTVAAGQMQPASWGPSS